MQIQASTIGIIGTSRKQDERRVPLHPDHLCRLPEDVRRQLVFETGYGKPFNLSDEELSAQSGGVASCNEILKSAGLVVIAKPVPEDLRELREGGVLWGYVHCAQQREMTQTAIDRKQTLIAFEDMFVWGPSGVMGRHTFYKNNELAGYCGVLHALQLKGIDGHYGNQRKAVIFGFGAVSRGALYALKAHGFRDLTICIQRPDHEVREEVLDCDYVRIVDGDPGEARMMVVEHDGRRHPLSDLISQSEIIVNGTFQDPSDPINFVTEAEASTLKPGSLIIDVSCDEGMGFYFAKPTSFRDPMFKVGTVDYYAVDHTPSFLWESASRCISAALAVYMPTVAKGRASWKANKTLARSINIEDGIVQKPAILAFQRRHASYPHASLDTKEKAAAVNRSAA
jgi:N5-(carboxyethyl)ornithine synthase